MINLYSAQIESLSIHRIGNKSRNEGAFLSKERYHLNDEITPLIKEFFFKPFRNKEENYYQFVHEADLEFHSLSNLAASLFNDPRQSHEIAVSGHSRSDHDIIRTLAAGTSAAWQLEQVEKI